MTKAAELAKRIDDEVQVLIDVWSRYAQPNVLPDDPAFMVEVEIADARVHAAIDELAAMAARSEG